MALIVLDIDDLRISEEERRHQTIEGLDKLHKAYYDLYCMPYEEFPRADGKTKAPLLKRANLFGYFSCRIALDPDGCHRAINKMLSAKDMQFLDPFTDEKWAYPVIPRSFFPPMSSDWAGKNFYSNISQNGLKCAAN